MWCSRWIYDLELWRGASQAISGVGFKVVAKASVKAGKKVSGIKYQKY